MMIDKSQGTTASEASDEVMQLAADSIADLGNGRAAASVPGASSHDPAVRREVVDAVFDDPRINRADHVSLTVPRGDTEALDEVRSRLEDQHTRSAGSTVIVEGRPVATSLTRPMRGRPRPTGSQATTDTQAGA